MNVNPPETTVDPQAQTAPMPDAAAMAEQLQPHDAVAEGATFDRMLEEMAAAQPDKTSGMALAHMLDEAQVRDPNEHNALLEKARAAIAAAPDNPGMQQLADRLGSQLEPASDASTPAATNTSASLLEQRSGDDTPTVEAPYTQEEYDAYAAEQGAASAAAAPAKPSNNPYAAPIAPPKAAPAPRVAATAAVATPRPERSPRVRADIEQAIGLVLPHLSGPWANRYRALRDRMPGLGTVSGLISALIEPAIDNMVTTGRETLSEIKGVLKMVVDPLRAEAARVGADMQATAQAFSPNLQHPKAAAPAPEATAQQPSVRVEVGRTSRAVVSILGSMAIQAMQRAVAANDARLAQLRPATS